MTDDTQADEERPAAIGRFADPTATATIDFPGGCRCPGTPHELDQAVIRIDLGDGEAKAVMVAGLNATGMEYLDWEAANDYAIARFTVSWNLLMEFKNDKGKTEIVPVPISTRMASLMDEPSRQALLTAFNDWRERQGVALPKASGGRSRGSSQAKGSRTRTTRTRS